MYVRLWPISAVQLSIAGCRSGKVTNGHDRQFPTHSGRSHVTGQEVFPMR